MTTDPVSDETERENLAEAEWRRFDYSIVRWVPDSFRGEFTNVAVICGAGDEWMIRARERTVDRWPVVAEYLKTVEAAMTCDEVDVAWLERERHDHRNLVQLTPLCPVMGVDVNEAVTLIFSHLVDEWDPAHHLGEWGKPDVGQLRAERDEALGLLRTAVRLLTTQGGKIASANTDQWLRDADAWLAATEALVERTNQGDET